MKFAGVTVLYNPTNNLLSIIESYINNIDVLYLVDNSDKINIDLIEKIKEKYNVRYISCNGNKGISYALNLAAKKALEENYNFLLTMDQDSTPTRDMINNIKNFIESNDVERIGIISPVHKIKGLKIEETNSLSEEVDMVMTSGNFLNLKAFQINGGFLEDLFIDHVDHEYCLRLKKNGYKVIKLNNAVLEHELGNIKKINFLNKKKFLVYHSPIRMYYFTRNGFYVLNKYKEFIFFKKYFLKQLKMDIIFRILFFDNKFQTLKFILKGYIDYRKNVLGKINI
ncbi:MAG: glycosyltransferase family 2 protein [Candidatus Sericytochromatia bacterium]